MALSAGEPPCVWGGYFFFWGGGKCKFYFYGRGDFSESGGLQDLGVRLKSAKLKPLPAYYDLSRLDHETSGKLIPDSARQTLPGDFQTFQRSCMRELFEVFAEGNFAEMSEVINLCIVRRSALPKTSVVISLLARRLTLQGVFLKHVKNYIPLVLGSTPFRGMPAQ